MIANFGNSTLVSRVKFPKLAIMESQWGRIRSHRQAPSPDKALPWRQTSQTTRKRHAWPGHRRGPSADAEPDRAHG
jgi:hypothetical protein